MKLIIDIPEAGFNTCKLWVKNSVASWEDEIIAKGIPYEERLQGDLISREALIKTIKSELDYASATGFFRKMNNIKSVDLACKILSLIGNVPSVDAIVNTIEERQQGEWIIVKDKKWGDNVKCPFCEKELAGTDLNFCCKCGAKLSGSEKMNGGAE